MTTASNHLPRPLSGRVAVVTGATSGIGEATARALAADGAAVALLGRRADRLDALAAELAAAGAIVAVPVPTDVADPASIRRAAVTVRAALGRVDLVVANAGVMYGAPFESGDTDEWDRMLDVNLRGLLHTGRAFVDDLLAAAEDGGRSDLVHVGSVGGHALFPGWAAYCATKAAVAHLTRNLRAELGPRGIRVKNVEPGVTVTELGADMLDAPARESLAGMRTTTTPLAAADIAAAIGPHMPRGSPAMAVTLSPARDRGRPLPDRARWCEGAVGSVASAAAFGGRLVLAAALALASVLAGAAVIAAYGVRGAVGRRA